MDQKQLNIIAADFLRNNYSLELTVPVKVNNQLKDTMGKFVHDNYEAQSIDLSGLLIKHATDKIILDTLKYELIHYALYILKEPYKSGDTRFESELYKQGVSSTRSKLIGRLLQFECPKCKMEIETSTLSIINNPEKFLTACCNEKLKTKRFVVCDGDEEIEFLYGD